MTPLHTAQQRVSLRVEAWRQRNQIHEGDERDPISASDEAWTAGTRGHSTRAALQGDPLAPRGAMSVDGDAAPRASAAHDLPACRLSPLNGRPRPGAARGLGRAFRHDWRDRAGRLSFGGLVYLGALICCWAPLAFLKVALSALAVTVAAAIAFWFTWALRRWCERFS